MYGPLDERLDEVDAFTTGTIGRPGQRTFFLQVRSGGARFDIKCEKVQVSAMADFLRNVLQDLPPAEDRPVDGAMELMPPRSDDFVLGQIARGYDPHNDRVVLQLIEVGERDLDDHLDDDDDHDDDDDDDHDELDDDELDDRARIRISITRSQAAAFCSHADDVVAAGRPNCRWCGRPIDPDGHYCVRMN